MAEQSVSAASGLCLHCGLCCDGTLFDSVPLRVNEQTSGALAPVGAAAFSQPCRALGENKCCAVYSERPMACRWFRCLLLTALESQEVTLEGAKAIVDETHRQVRQIESWLPKQPRTSTLQAAFVSLEMQTQSQFEQVEALRHRLRFHFVGMSKLKRTVAGVD